MKRVSRKLRPARGSRRPLPAELAKDAIAHEEKLPGDKVRMTFRLVLPGPVAEALTAEAIRRETNLETLVQEILQVAASNKKNT